MRLLSMDGPNMLHDHFSNLLPNTMYRSSSFLECSRFIVTKNASRTGSAALFVAAGEVLRNNNTLGILASFTQSMQTIYKKHENAPRVLASMGHRENWIGVGIWRMSYNVWKKSLQQIGASERQSNFWYSQRLERQTQNPNQRIPLRADL